MQRRWSRSVKPKIVRFILVLAVIVFAVCLAALLSCRNASAPSVPLGQIKIIDTDYSNRFGAGTIDATSKHIYLLYAQDDLICVYNWSGEYQYAIVLPREGQNGVPQIRCSDDLLYIQTNNYHVFVVDEQELVGDYPPGTFDNAEQGVWFPTRSIFGDPNEDKLIQVKGNKVLDKDGNVIMRFRTSSPDGIGSIVIAVLVLAFLILVIFVDHRRKKNLF